MGNKKNNNINKDKKRGDTFVGYRPSVMKTGKDKANSRQARKNETRKRINDDWERQNSQKFQNSTLSNRKIHVIMRLK